MQSVKVNIQKMEISRFHPREPVEFKIYFNDGAEKCLIYETDMKTPVMDATAVIGKIKRYEKDKNRVDDAEDILDAFVNVMIDDEEELVPKIANFFNRIKDEKKRVLNNRDHTTYMKNLNQMHSMKIEFKQAK